MPRPDYIQSTHGLPIRPQTRVIMDDRHAATCSRCGSVWHPVSRNQYSPCCYRFRLKPGQQPEGKPARHPFHQPMAGDRISVSAGKAWREVVAAHGNQVSYRTSGGDAVHYCNQREWHEYAAGKSRGGGRCPAKVEKRGDA